MLAQRFMVFAESRGISGLAADDIGRVLLSLSGEAPPVPEIAQLQHAPQEAMALPPMFDPRVLEEAERLNWRGKRSQVACICFSILGCFPFALTFAAAKARTIGPDDMHFIVGSGFVALTVFYDCGHLRRGCQRLLSTQAQTSAHAQFLSRTRLGTLPRTVLADSARRPVGQPKASCPASGDSMPALGWHLKQHPCLAIRTCSSSPAPATFWRCE